MNSTNLARLLEDFETDIQPLKLREEPASRRVIDELLQAPAKPARRASRVGGIQIGDQGLRSFRVR